MTKTTALIDALGLDLPPFESIAPEAMPQPYRDLLVHQSDMTGKLEGAYRQTIRLQPLRVDRGERHLRRHVLLKTEDGRTVEFGAIRIHLNVFEDEARERVLGCRQPLGGILNQFGVPYRCRLAGFFRLPVDDRVCRLLGECEGPWLYGRQNRLVHKDGRPIAEVVEILP